MSGKHSRSQPCAFIKCGGACVFTLKCAPNSLPTLLSPPAIVPRQLDDDEGNSFHRCSIYFYPTSWSRLWLLLFMKLAFIDTVLVTRCSRLYWDIDIQRCRVYNCGFKTIHSFRCLSFHACLMDYLEVKFHTPKNDRAFIPGEPGRLNIYFNNSWNMWRMICLLSSCGSN